MLYLFAYLYHFFLPGLLLAYLLNLRRLTYLLAFSLSYVLLILNLLSLQYAGAPVHWFTWLVNLEVTILFLLVLGKALARSRPTSGGFQDILGPAARALKGFGQSLARRAGSVLIVAALFVLLVGYVIYAGPYTEVPADAWAHLARFQTQCEILRDGRFAANTSLAGLILSQGDHWYFLHAYLCCVCGITVRQSLGVLTLANTLTFAFGFFFMGLFVFARQRSTRRQKTLIAAAATLFCITHLGVSVFSYVRYYAFAPALLNMIIALTVLAMYWAWLEGRWSSLGALCLLPLLVLTMVVVHSQEFVLAAFMSLSITLVAFCRAVPWMYRSWRGRAMRVSSLSERARCCIWRLIAGLLGVAGGFSVLFAVLHVLRPVHLDYGWLLMRVPSWIPWLHHGFVVDPARSFAGVVTWWGGLVYVLFVLRIDRFRKYAYLMGGMLLPLFTVFNPLTVDMALRYAPSAVTVLYRMGYMLPLPFVAGYLAVEAGTRLVSGGRKGRGKQTKADGQDKSQTGLEKLVNGLIVAGLILLLIPLRVAGNPLWLTRALTLRRVPPANNYTQWNDLIGFLNASGKRRIITDPVTGYVLNGLACCDSPTHKFVFSSARLHLSDGCDLVSYVLRDITGDLDSDWLLVLNERDGGLSETGRISGHWPERILKVSDYWSPGLKAYVNAHPECFRKMWERNRIEVYDVEEQAVKAALSTVPVLVSATPMLFEGPGIQLDWTDVRSDGFVAYHVQCSEDGVNWLDIDAGREYRYSWINHQGKQSDVFGKWSWCLPSSKTYYYRVRALYRSGPAPWSNIEKATVHKYR